MFSYICLASQLLCGERICRFHHWAIAQDLVLSFVRVNQDNLVPLIMQYLSSLLRYTLHTIKFTLLEYKIQWVFLSIHKFMQHSSLSNSTKFLSLPEETPHPILCISNSTSLSLSFQPLVTIYFLNHLLILTILDIS